MKMTQLRQSQIKGLVQDLEKIKDQIKTFKSPIDLIINMPLDDNNDGDLRVCLEDNNVYIWNAKESLWKLSSGNSSISIQTSNVTIDESNENRIDTGIMLDEDVELSKDLFNIYLNGMIIDKTSYDLEVLESKVFLNWIDEEQLVIDDLLLIQYFKIELSGQSGGSSSYTKKEIDQKLSEIQLTPGPQGEPGIQGRDGEPGKDGLTTAILLGEQRYEHVDGTITLPEYPKTLPANGGNADTVNGLTVESSVPADAKFTDTIYVHPNDSDSRHVTDLEKETWNAKETTDGSQAKADKALHDAKSYTDTKVADLVSSAPETLDTLNELAIALGNDPNFATTIANQIGTKVDKQDGKGLSTNDYTTIEKNKLASIAENANNYVHPSNHEASMITGLSTIATSGSYNDLLDIPSAFTPSEHTHTADSITGLVGKEGTNQGSIILNDYVNNVSSGKCSLAEGSFTSATGSNSHAEGYGTTSSGGGGSHSEGMNTTASGYASHAEGSGTVASGQYSHAEGNYTTAPTFLLHVQGRYNNYNKNEGVDWWSTTNDAFVIGNGRDKYAVSNAFRVDYSGAVYGLSAFNSTGADYAEYFEWEDGNPDNEDRIGKFVTLNGNKIRIANENDDYILGIMSGNQSVIGNACEDQWSNMYLRDEYGRLQYEYVETEKEECILNNETGELQTKTMLVKENHIKLNPNYDPDAVYIPRSKRKEWGVVGMLGQILVTDDGTCQINGYCKPNQNGIATKSESGYRVMKRLSDNVILVLFK